MERAIKIGLLFTPVWKYEEANREVIEGKLSHSFNLPCVVSYCPTARKYLLQDGNHRAIERVANGEKSIICIVNEFQPKIYYTTGSFITLSGKLISIN